MGQLSRWGSAAVVAVAALLISGCGGSVADADADRPTATARSQPASPFCTAAQAHTDAIRPLNTLANGGSTAQSLAGAVEEVRRTGAELQRQAPDEIRPDVERAVTAVNLQLDVLVANDGDPDALARDPELTARLSSPELAGAGERYQAYVARTCSPAGADRGDG